MPSRNRRSEPTESDSDGEEILHWSAIALAAYAGDINYQQAMTAGFQRHLAKPVDPEVLVRAIADLVSKTSVNRLGTTGGG